MPRYGIVSDLHGNVHALRAALRFLLEDQGVGGILCLGDIVGYNADSDACIKLLGKHQVLSVAGNHDLIAIGALGTERCALRAAFALSRTQETLSEAGRKVLRGLPRELVIEDDVLLIHGGIDDVCQYVRTPRQIEENHARMVKGHPGARICFFGHTHEQRVFEVRGGIAVEKPRSLAVDLSGPGTYFVNPGSIDAARKTADRVAELAVFDSTKRAVSFHRIAYDHGQSERRAVLSGYRMTPLDERILRARSMYRSGKRRALQELHRMLPLFE